MKTKTLLALLVIVLTLTACGGAQNEIVGTWEDADGVLYIFEEDGSLTLAAEGIEVTGTYEFIDKDTMEVELETTGLGITLLDVEISGDTLTLKENGTSTELTRVE
jgi:ABC-type glycerol-3-phosphate transport system substrate-binding protein